MSKELTEQWRNGTLKEGYYYIENKSQSIKFVEIDYYNVFGDTRYWSGCDDEDIEEVLAPVPSYQEWEELQEASDGLSKLMFKSLMNRFVKADEERERLEEQLKDANEVIKYYAEAHQLTEEEKQMTAEKYHLVYGLKAYDYLNKHG